jgi:hypothetical protein
MSKATHVQRPLFGPWLAWERLPDPVREKATDVLAAICLEIADVCQIDQQTADDLSTAEGIRPRFQKASPMESESDDAHPH